MKLSPGLPWVPQGKTRLAERSARRKNRGETNPVLGGTNISLDLGARIILLRPLTRASAPNSLLFL